MVAEVPEAFPMEPLSPGCSSTLQTTVPSGIELIGKTLPV